jgi:hypothetical protein
MKKKPLPKPQPVVPVSVRARDMQQAVEIAFPKRVDKKPRRRAASPVGGGT